MVSRIVRFSGVGLGVLDEGTPPRNGGLMLFRDLG
jgi:hypothetical protein